LFNKLCIKARIEDNIEAKKEHCPLDQTRRIDNEQEWSIGIIVITN